MLDYIEANEISESLTVDISGVEGFLKLVSLNSIRVIFSILPHKDETDKENLFFFPLNGIIYRLNGKHYKTLEDYQEAITNGFLTSAEYYEAKALGFISYEEYKHCKELGIDKKDEFEDAKRTGFVKGFDSFNQKHDTYKNSRYIKELPEKFQNPVELHKYAVSKYFTSYKELETAFDAGFPDFRTWKDAEAKGFKDAHNFYLAVSEGFNDFKEYVEARELLISSKKEYDIYKYLKKNCEGLNYDEFQLLHVLRNLENGKSYSLKEIIDKLENEKDIARRTIGSDNEKILPAWYKRGIESEEKIKIFLTENKSVRLVGFYDNQTDKFEVFKISKSKIYIDASNVAFNRSTSDVKFAEFNNVLIVVNALKEKGFTEITAIADASLKHKVRDESKLKDLKKAVNYYEVPSNTSADDFLLQSARNEKCLIVSNDTFTDWKIKDRWIANNIEDIRQPFMITNNKVVFAGLEKLLKEIK